MNVITVIIADDHPLVRKALRNELSEVGDFEVLAEASDGLEAVKLATKLKPDVVVMDIGLPELNGIEATRRIKTVRPKTIVLVLTVYDDTEHLLGILESGADGYLTKTVMVEDIIQAIHSVAAGQTVLSPHIFQKVLKCALRHSYKVVSIDSQTRLTTRELEILQLIGRGLGNKQIACELDLSIRTIKSHLIDIFSKLKVSSRTAAVITALRCGFIKAADLDLSGLK